MDSKRIRFGLTYTGGIRFMKDVVEGVDLKSIECVSVENVHYVLLTLVKPCHTCDVVDGIRAFNEKIEDEDKRLRVIPFQGEDIVTFAKAQGYMQHPFYAPFEEAKKTELDGGSTTYWCWEAEGPCKRVAKELESDFVETCVKPASKKRAGVAPGREVGGCVGLLCAHMLTPRCAQPTDPACPRKRRARKSLYIAPKAPVASLIPMDLVYEIAKCKDETIRAKNYAIQLLESMLKKAPVEGA